MNVTQTLLKVNDSSLMAIARRVFLVLLPRKKRGIRRVDKAR